MSPLRNRHERERTVNGENHSSSAKYLYDSLVSTGRDSARNDSVGLPSNGEHLVGEPGADDNRAEVCKPTQE